MYSVKSQFENLSPLLDFGMGVSHLDQCPGETGSIVAGSVVINEWKVLIILVTWREAEPVSCAFKMLLCFHAKMFTLMLHFFE